MVRDNKKIKVSTTPKFALNQELYEKQKLILSASISLHIKVFD